jgi:hypothetical protein
VSQVVVWASDRRQCAGAVIEVLDDAHVLTPAERDNPDWVTLQVSPDLTPSEIAALCTHSTVIVASRVQYRVDVADLPVACVTALTAAEFRARVREV